MPETPSIVISGRRLEAAELLAQDRLSVQEVADRVGVTYKTLQNWRWNPSFEAKVLELREQIQKELRARGIREKLYRIDSYANDFERTQMIVEGRALDMTDVPGGESGFLVRQSKIVGKLVVEEYAFDAALMSERRALRKQIAQELGEWTERADISGTIKREYVIRTVNEDEARDLGGDIDYEAIEAEYKELA